MSQVKVLLNKINDSIKQKLFSQASYEVDCLLEIDSRNFMAYVFKAYILFHHEQNYKEAEKNYIKATEIDPSKEAGWQGLVEVYSKYNHFDGLVSAWEKLLQLYFLKQEFGKCHDLVFKIIEKYEEIGQADKAKQWYSYFIDNKLKFGDLINVQKIHSRLIEIEEESLERSIKKEVQQRRFRLGAPPLDQIEDEVYALFIDGSCLNSYYEDYYQQYPADYNVINKYLVFLSRKIKVSSDKQRIFSKVISLFQHADHIDGLTKLWLFDRTNSASFDDYIYDLLLDNRDSGETSIPLEVIESVKYLKKYQEGYSSDTIDKLNVSGQFLFPYLVKLLLVTKIRRDYNLALSICQEVKSFLAKRQEQEGIVLDKVRNVLVGCLEAECLIERGVDSEELIRGREILLKISSDSFDNPYISKGIILSYQKERDFDNAIKYLLLSKDQDSPNFLSHYGYLLYMNRNYEESIKVLEKSIALRTESSTESASLSDDYYYLGCAKWEASIDNQKDKSVCFKLYASSLSYNTENDKALLRLGYYYKDICNDVVKANKCFEKSFFVSHGTNSAAGNELTTILILKSKFVEAAEILESLLESDPKNFEENFDPNELWFKLGKIQIVNRKYGDAIFSIQKGLRKNSDNVQGWISLGDAYHKQGRYISSIKALGKALKLVNKEAGYNLIKYKMGCVKYDLGIFEECKNLLEQVIDAETNEYLLFSSRFHLAKCFHDYSLEQFEKIGNFPKCFDLMERSLSLFQGLLGKIDNEEINKCIRKGISDCLLFLYKHKVEHIELVEQDLSSAFESSIFHFYKYQKSKDRQDFAKAIQLMFQVKDCRTSKMMNNLGVYFASYHEKHMYEPLAQHCYIAAIEEESSSVSWSNLGLLYFNSGDIELAKECFSQSYTINPEYYVPWIVEGYMENILETSNNFSTKNDGTKIIHSLLLTNRTNVEVNLVYCADLIHRNERIEEAFYALSKVREYHFITGRRDIFVENMLCVILERMKLYERARIIYEPIISEKSSKSFRFNFARILCSAGHYEESLKIFESMPLDQVDMIYTHSVCLTHMGQMKKAIQILEATLELSEIPLRTYLRLLTLLGQVYLQLYLSSGEEAYYSKAGETLLKAVNKEDTFIPALLVLFSIGILSSDLDLCDSVILKVLNIPKNLLAESKHLYDCYMLLSDYYDICLNDKKRAISMVQRAFFYNPSNTLFEKMHDRVQNLLGYEEATSLNMISGKLHKNPSDKENYLGLYFMFRSRALEELNEDHLNMIDFCIDALEQLGTSEISHILRCDKIFLKILLGGQVPEHEEIARIVQGLDEAISSGALEKYRTFTYYVMCNLLILLGKDHYEIIANITENFFVAFEEVAAGYYELMGDNEKSFNELSKIHERTVNYLKESEGKLKEKLTKDLTRINLKKALQGMSEENGERRKECLDGLNQCMAILENDSMEFNLCRIVQMILQSKEGTLGNKGKITKAMAAVEESGHISERLMEKLRNYIIR